MNSVFVTMVLFFGAEQPIIKIETPKELKVMEFLIGKWKGEGEWPGLGKYEDEFHYSWLTKHKTFLKASYEMKVKGEVVWSDENVMGYDPDLKKVVGFTFGMDGSLGRGVATVKKENEWEIEGKSVGNTPFKEWKMTLKKIDNDTLEMIMVSKNGDKWEPAMTTKYKRITEAKK
jgi:hypothetical protein